MTVDSARSYASRTLPEWRRQMIEFLEIPSISTLTQHTDDCTRAAEWLAARMRDAGLENIEVIQGVGRPLVYADWLHAPGAPTILLYGHYDVQPVDPIELWLSPPFQPDIRGDFIFARGAADDKGQVLMLVAAAEAYLRSEGRLPVNLKFVIEGEEESGGEHIKHFLRTEAGRLTADFAHVADSSFFDASTPSVDTGLRGVVYTQITVNGASHDLHSGEYGGVAPNPFISLAHLIAKLRDEQGIIKIPGFYDDVVDPSREILQSWSKLGVTDEAVAAEIEVRKLIGDPNRTPLERMWSQPTLDVHGMPGGFIADGAKTVIPAIASAKVSMRIVPNQDAEKVFAQFKKAVHDLAPDDVTVEVELIHGDNPVVVPDDTREVQAALQALQEVYDKEPVMIRTGGSIPVVGLFQEQLGIPSVLLGFGLPRANLHAPNEHFSLTQFEKGIHTNIVFWNLAGT